MTGGRFAAPAVVVGGTGALARALVLADPAPGLVAGVLRAVTGWGAAGLLLLAGTVAWTLVADRELGRAQRRHEAGRSVAEQLRDLASTRTRGFLAAVPGAAAGGLVATLAAQVRAGRLDVAGPGGPGAAFVAAAAVLPVVGVALGALVGLAAPDRRRLAWGAAWAVVLTVTVLLLRPFSTAAEAASVWTPLGGVWPVTSGWSASRRFALDPGVAARAASTVAWLALLARPAARRWRDGPARRP